MHSRTTAQEILRDFAGERLDYWVTGFGTGGTLIASLPVIIPAVLWIWWPWVGYLTPPIGLACGSLALRIGIRQGGKVLDRRWPEVMVAVSERTA